METIRSFIAIELPEEVKQAINRLQSRLKREDYPVKWVGTNSIHLTLKFLGDITVDRVDPITRAIEKAAQSIPPFRLEVKELGVFPNPRRVQVIWVGLTGAVEPLCQLQQHIEATVNPLGFTTEARPFTAHLTLGRVRDNASPDERENLGQLIARTHFEGDYSFTVNSINLMKSQLTREGAIYSCLSLARLS